MKNKYFLLLCSICCLNLIACKKVEPIENDSSNIENELSTVEVSSLDESSSLAEETSKVEETSSIIESEALDSSESDEQLDESSETSEETSQETPTPINISLINEYAAIEIATNDNAKNYVKNAFTADIKEVSKAYLDCGGLKLGSSSADGTITLSFDDITIYKVEVLARQYAKSYSYQSGGQTVSGFNIDSEATFIVNEQEHSFTSYTDEGEPISENIIFEFDSTNEITFSSLNGRIIVFNVILYLN